MQPNKRPTQANKRPTRDVIVHAAAKLFRGIGIRDVSLDMVAAEAGLTKRTIYYHFRSKDEIIAAYLEARDMPNLETFKQWFDATEGTLADKVEGIFRHLAVAAHHPKWKGCGFLRTTVELVKTPGHPAMEIARAHKKRVEDWLAVELTAGGLAAESETLARQILLLLDGAFSTVLLNRDPSYMETAGLAAANLVRHALASRA
ncbi:TetR/AcrR family transcriptional regulator [Stappia taiwanensis]|uniref:TetR/AcrR family transcriptional regulator n=1 Tax=Stappia taiwanensis TaxID=992267 RepID=A0A838XRU1_9HYPH|nr:TetR/AcrR family transcriptional regulator [Stappia taiwanensis]MBA4611781.1 TetR/AcrR family transcriptional regulator [Stappia taiwanensis]GGE96822.1 TetR family transcriptional regulator [Stappia taiwanensis]